MVARMAPPPGDRIPDDLERGDVVDHVVHPAGPECGTVPAFMPAGIAGRAVHDPIGQPERHCPPAAPEVDAAGGKDHMRRSPDDRVADRRPVGALHQVLHHLARDVGVIPLGGGQPDLLGIVRRGTGQAVVARWGMRGGLRRGLRHVGIGKCGHGSLLSSCLLSVHPSASGGTAAPAGFILTIPRPRPDVGRSPDPPLRKRNKAPPVRCHLRQCGASRIVPSG